MNSENAPEPPVRRGLPEDDPCRRLHERVREAIASVPVYFRSETNISGIMATDLHTLNTVLGASIEEQVVRTLNLMRSTWDPEESYPLYNFARQSQTFPDVLLRKSSTGEVLMGVELKGWYLLAKESEPSLRFQVTPAACAPRDLIVVVPWVLGNVISGSPILFEPYVEFARYAAEFRNYHWTHVRQTNYDASIEFPGSVGPYPRKSDPILDRPVRDGGGNFGRIARTGLMDDYMARLNHIKLCGIDADFWRQFLKIFQDDTSEAQVRAEIEKIRQRAAVVPGLPHPKVQAALTIIAEIERLFGLE